MGEKWITTLPDEWCLKQIRHIFRIHNGATPKSGENEYWNGDINWITPEDLGNNDGKEIIESRRKITSEGYVNSGVSLAPAGSIAISTRAPIGHLAKTTIPSCVNQGCRLLEPKEGNPDYWYYAFIAAKPVLVSCGQGTTFMELPRQSLASVKLPFPSDKEQQTIARFLDFKTAQIDALIAKQKALLEKLAEKRTALISHAVTKGLDPSAPMKDSGVEWLGKVPKHWIIKRIKNLTTYNDELLDECTDSDLEIEYVDISSVNLINGIEKTETMPFDKSPSRARRKVKDGDIIISTVRTYLKAIATINNPPDNMIVSTGFAVIRPKDNVHTGFAGYLLQTPGFIGEVVALSVGVSYPAINSSDLVRISVVAPPFEEQQAIAKFLDEKIELLDVQRIKIESAILKIKEYRAALITNAVTGKIDVRNFHLPTAIEPEERVHD